MWRLADRQIDEFVDRGALRVHRRRTASRSPCSSSPTCSACRRATTSCFASGSVPGRASRPAPSGSTGDEALAHNPLEFLYEQFTAYVEDRRREPRDDVLTGLATATFPDGSIPEAIDVARIAANLFAAGQETTVRLFGAALQRLGDDPELQRLLREHREHIPNFVEECLRIESPVKGDFRLARVTTELGGVEIPAGTTLMVVNGAANRDPGRFERPSDFRGRARQRAPAPRVRPRRPHVSRCTARARRGSHHHRATARPDGRHQDLREGARPARRPPLRLRADLHPPRRQPPTHRVRTAYRMNDDCGHRHVTE